MDPDPRMMTATEVAKLLRISTDTVHRLASRGELWSCKVGRQRRFRESDITAMVAERESGERPVEVAS